MKILLIPIIFLGTLPGLRAEYYRNWTDAETKKQIEASMVEFNKSEVRVLMRSGKTVWLRKDRLIPEDQRFIDNWIKPVDHISARIVGSSKGKKKVMITAMAGSRPLVVKAFWRDSGSQPKGYPIVYNLKEGEKKTFTYEASNKYVVKGWSGNELVDEEAWNSKTGL